MTLDVIQLILCIGLLLVTIVFKSSTILFNNLFLTSWLDTLIKNKPI